VTLTLSMNRSAEHQLGLLLMRIGIEPSWCSALRFTGSFDLQQWTRIWAMHRSGGSVERRILAGGGTAALCRDAATSRFVDRVLRCQVRDLKP